MSRTAGSADKGGRVSAKRRSSVTIASPAARAEPHPAGNASRREQRIFYRLFRAGLMIRAIMDHIGQGQGVTLSQYTLLSLVGHRSDMTTARLARRLDISPQSVNEMVSTLLDGGYLNKIRSEEDRRLQVLGLTEKGRVQLEKAEQAMDQAEALCFEYVSPKERDAFAKVLGEIVRQGSTLSQPQSDPERK